jgi:hypothetical protein
MFNLTRELRRWRRSLSRHGVLGRDELDELESHLRDSFEAIERDGTPPVEAFAMARSRIGDPRILANEYEKSQNPSTRRLWRAFWVAPAVAPILMAIEIFVLGMAFSDPADPGTPIGIILLPILLLTLGGFIAYGIAAICWMPLIFFWRKRGWLNGGRLHLLAFLLALAVVALLEATIYAITTPRPTDFFELLSSSLIIAGFVIPNVMLSAVVFWMIVRPSSDRRMPLDAG